NCNPTIASSPSTFEPLKVFSFPLQDPVKAFAISHKLDFLSHIASRDTLKPQKYQIDERISSSPTLCKQNASPLQDHCKGLEIWMQAE
ncbi:MAG: hypothetical protein II863_17800, partial [Kiritimatiellae bacterium]|nr:hypothetical protein [Kiritimatiellia bacterium]